MTFNDAQVKATCQWKGCGKTFKGKARDGMLAGWFVHARERSFCPNHWPGYKVGETVDGVQLPPPSPWGEGDGPGTWAATSPSPRSPQQARHDPLFKDIQTKQVPCWPGYSDQCVVQHIATGAYWACSYAVGEDDSDYAVANTGWVQVLPREETAITFAPVPVVQKLPPLWTCSACGEESADVRPAPCVQHGERSSATWKAWLPPVPVQTKGCHTLWMSIREDGERVAHRCGRPRGHRDDCACGFPDCHLKPGHWRFRTSRTQPATDLVKED